MAAVTMCILELPKIKSVIVSHETLPICHEVMGLDAVIFVFLKAQF